MTDNSIQKIIAAEDYRKDKTGLNSMKDNLETDG
jgi:hypothetical protein